MPVTIWEPRRYVAEFSIGETGAAGSHRYRPQNGTVAGDPYARDTKVREVARFSGWTKERYADTGECEIVIYAGQVQAADVQKGYMLEVDGKHYLIEDYEWERTENGYECTVSGRDFGGRYDSEMPTQRVASGAVFGTLADIGELGTVFFDGYVVTEADAAYALPEVCGWFRDRDRMVDGAWVRWEIEDEYSLTDPFNETQGGNLEVVSYGALTRYMCNFFDLGYRFEIEYDEIAGLHTVQMVFYRPGESDVVINSSNRGISGFKYEYTTRDSINAAFVVAKTRWLSGLDVEPTKYDDPKFGIFIMPFKTEGDNWAEVANAWSGRAIDVGEVPEENDAEYGDAAAWLAEQLGDVYSSDGEAVSFSYDNSGAYRYGEHFGLGSKITVLDDFLGKAVAVRLYGVKKTYDAGDVVNYEFEFGDQHITQADKLKKRFAELDRKTYSI